MRITEKKLREMIRSKILREFLGQGASSGVGFPEIEEPLEREGSSVVKFSAYMTQGSSNVMVSRGQFDYSAIMEMSPREAFTYFNELRMIKLMMDFKREYLAVPGSEEEIVRTLTSVPFGSQFPEPAYILKYKDLELQIRKDFSTHDSCVTTRMGSLGSTIFASCPRSELVTPEALEALAQHVVS